MKSVGILGCGWLGTALAQSLIEQGVHVKGSCTSAAKATSLKYVGIKGYVIDLQSYKISGDLTFFDSIEALFICIPPKRGDKTFSLNQSLHHLFSQIPALLKTKILFTSSISVYGNQPGVLTEERKLQPETENAKELVASEKVILDSSKNSVVIRLGGLIGDDRNPINSLYNKRIANPNGNINFISQKDAVEGLRALLFSDAQGVFNLVTPHHPTRKDYYTFAAQKWGYTPPKFYEEQGVKKIVKGEKITHFTSFQYTVNNLLI